MPSENKTPNLGLSQWQGNEYIKRQDFVEDNQKIDTAFGNLEALTTEEKSDLVSAVNEVDDAIKTHRVASMLQISNINNAFMTHQAESSKKHVHSSGSNWIKYDCGIAECWGTLQVTGRINTEWGGWFYLTVGSTSYPQEVGFIARPYCVFFNLSARACFLTQVGGTASTTPTVDIYRPIADTSDQTYTIGYRAIGRWK